MMMAGSAAVASQVQGLAAGAHLASNPGAERTRLRSSFAGAALRPGGGRSAAVVWSRAGAGAGAGVVYASPRAVMERIVPAQPNFYELLGLPQDVALPDIKLAYRQMAKKFHPDVCPPGQSKECAEKFIEVQEAYETLSDPRRRASYDRDMANSLSAIASGRRRCADAPSAAEWKSQWEDQLSTLKRRAAVRNTAAPESWGARMRRQREQHQPL